MLRNIMCYKAFDVFTLVDILDSIQKSIENAAMAALLPSGSSNSNNSSSGINNNNNNSVCCFLSCRCLFVLSASFGSSPLLLLSHCHSFHHFFLFVVVYYLFAIWRWSTKISCHWFSRLSPGSQFGWWRSTTNATVIGTLPNDAHIKNNEAHGGAIWNCFLGNL